MATNTPTLEQLTGSLDALPNSLDNLDGLPWCGPTLEQLDAWGGLEALDAFGYNLEQLNQLCVVVADGAASVAITTTAEIAFAELVDAAVDISVSASSVPTRTVAMQASVTGAAGVTASIKPIRQVTATASLEASQASSTTRTRQVVSASSVAVTASGLAGVVYRFNSAVAVSASTTAASSGIFVLAGRPRLIASATVNAKVLGEDWFDVAAGSEIWTDVTVGSEIWGAVSASNGVWAKL